MDAPEWTGMRRLLAVRLDNLGDVVLTGPALRRLRAAAPHARLDLLASPAGAAAAALLPEVNRVLPWRTVWQDAGSALPLDPARELALVEHLAAARYDAAVIFTSFSQTPWPAAYATYLAGIPVRAAIAPDFGGSLLTHPVPPPAEGLHQAERGLVLVAAVTGQAAGESSLAVQVPAAGRRQAARLLPEGPYALLAPGASCPSRRWPADRFAALAASLPLPVVVVGSAGEADLVTRVAGRQGLPLAGVLDVPGLAAAVQSAAVVVTNNSGCLHLADALRRPTVVLFAGTERLGEFGPRSAPHTVLSAPVPCSPCRAFHCPFSGECLDVDVDTVRTAACELLTRAPEGTC